MQLSAEERKAILGAFDSISDESDTILPEAATALSDPAAERDPATVFENTDITPRKMEHALNEVMEKVVELILTDIDTWIFLEARGLPVLREQHFVTCQESQTVGSRALSLWNHA